MQLSRDGAQHFAAALTPDDLARLEAALVNLPPDRPGNRIGDLPFLTSLLSADGPVGRIATPWLGKDARPVRAVLFNKTASRNWGLGWHQDRTIAVRERVETSGFANWTVKSGICHVEPPFDLLEGMLTLRVHLDPVDAANAPLLVVPGSHRLGRIPEPERAAIVDRLGSFACLADRGDIWLYATPILHASASAARPASRRVLQVDYASQTLPGRLAWLGV